MCACAYLNLLSAIVLFTCIIIIINSDYLHSKKYFITMLYCRRVLLDKEKKMSKQK